MICYNRGKKNAVVAFWRFDMDIEKIKSVVIGHAVADALGVPVEFYTREELDEAPVTEMEGFGTYPMPAGAWSDDTSMSLCTLEVLGKYGLDFDRIMQNFAKWYYQDEFTPTGEMFDVGNTCSIAIENYIKYKKPYTMCGLNGERNNGNGSLMRIYPFVLYLADKAMPIAEKMEIIHTASALTHAHIRAKIGCGIYAFVLWEVLRNPQKESVLKGLEEAKMFYREEKELKAYSRIFDRAFIVTHKKRIKSSGYVVDTLEAVLWSILTTNSYQTAVLKAVNLGDDTDTVGAITGALAGALYGYEAIPDRWKRALLKRDYIEELCAI